MHVFEHSAVFADEYHLEKIADDERRNDDLLAFDMRCERRNAEGDVRIRLDDLGNQAVRLVSKKLDVLWMAARVGHPDPALLDPVLARLLLGRGDADMIEDQHAFLW